MKKSRVILIIGTVILSTLLLVSCFEKAQVPYTVLKVEESKSTTDTFISVHIKVPPATVPADLERVLNKVLEVYKIKTPIEKSVIHVYAYDSEPFQNANPIGDIFQGYAGRITFTHNGKTTYDRPIESPALSREERERQQEVGKFAGELIDAGKKIQNR
jgi:hypothetical protein